MDKVEKIMRKYSRCFGCKILEKEIKENEKGNL